MVENTGKKTKLQTQRPTVVNLPAILIGAKWQTVKDSATSSASHSLLAFNKAIYTFLLGLLVACCFPKGSAAGLKSVDNVPTCHAELFLEILLRRRMPLPEACRRPGHVHFPEEDGRTSAFASETASLSLLWGRWTAQILLVTVVDYIDSFSLHITSQC